MADLFRKPRGSDPGKPILSIDDHAAKQAMGRLRKDPPGGCRAAKHDKDKVEDGDMIASMAKRLALLEKEVKLKTQELQKAQAKLRAAEDATAQGGQGVQAAEASQVQAENARLRAECNRAWRQVADMKVFLNDYGMVWVGEDGPSPTANKASPRAGLPPSGPQDARPGPSGAQPRPPDGERSEGNMGPPRRRSYNGASGLGGGASSNGAASPAAGDVLLGGPVGQSAAARLPLAPVAGSSREDAGRAGGGPTAGLPFKMADLLARVEELNQLAGDGCGQLVPAAGAAGAAGQARVLHTPEPVRLTVFRDGIQLHRAAAKPFGDPGVDAVLADILDGYFPITLKAEFPDGIPIKVVERLRDSYRDALSPLDHPAMRGGAAGNVRTFHDLEGGAGLPMSRDGFLSRLPQAVIKNGKVVDVRGGVGAAMGAPSAAKPADANVSLVATPADALLTTSQRNHKGPVLPPPSREAASRPAAALPAGQQPAAPAGLLTKAGSLGRQAGATSMAEPALAATQQGPHITTLQVKNEDGDETLIIKLQYDDTIGALRKYIDAHRAKQKDGPKSKDYEIRSSFPPRKYDDASDTLRAAGLVPNATLFLRRCS